MDGLPPLLEHKQLTGPPGCITPIGARYDDRGRKLDTLGRVATTGSPRGHRKLGPKPRAFVTYFLKCNDATRAAVQAGYSKKSAHRIASELLKRDDVRHEVQRLLEERQVGADRVIDMLSMLATFDPADAMLAGAYTYEQGRRVVDWGTLKDIGASIMVKEVVGVGMSGHELIRWHNRTDAINMLARIHGMTRDRVDVNITDVRSASVEELMALASLK